MIGRIVEVAEDGRHLSVMRGFMTVSAGGEELGRVPLDDLAAVIANAHGLTYSNNLLIALSSRNVPVVLCAANHTPAALLWPVDGHHQQAMRMRAQIGAPKPLCKRIWQTIVRAKIIMQGAAAAQFGNSASPFEMLARKVRSGDPENVEAQAARRYWPLIFGEQFRRDPALPGVNSQLSYGYAVLRSAVARAVMGAGLHPTLGIHHHNRNNPMCLVDDLMEPFRPLVDLTVVSLQQRGIEQVDSEAKRCLAMLLVLDMSTRHGVSPVATCLERLAISVALAYESGAVKLELPLAPLPLDLIQAGGGV